MPTIITGSPNIYSLDSKIIADLCAGNFIVDITPSAFIGDGAANVLGVRVKIVNPQGITVKEYSESDYDIATANPFIGTYSFPVPTQAGNYQYGRYIISVQLTDAGGAVYETSKSVTICIPDRCDKTKKYGSLGAKMDGIRKNGIGELIVMVDNIPTYNGHLVDSFSQSFVLKFPTDSQLPNFTTDLSYFSKPLFSGVYRFTGDICATYNFGDDVYVNVPYKVNAKKEIFYSIDEDKVLNILSFKYNLIETLCEGNEREKTLEEVRHILLLLKLIELSKNEGYDPSQFICKLQYLLGVSLALDTDAPINVPLPEGNSLSIIFADTKAIADSLLLIPGQLVRVQSDETSTGSPKSMYLCLENHSLEFLYYIP